MTSKRQCRVPVLHGISTSQTLDDLSDGGPLLSDSDVDAVQLLLLVFAVVETLLVDDCIDGDCGFAGLTIADDQLTLATTNGHKRIDGLDASLKE